MYSQLKVGCTVSSVAFCLNIPNVIEWSIFVVCNIMKRFEKEKTWRGATSSVQKSNEQNGLIQLLEALFSYKQVLMHIYDRDSETFVCLSLLNGYQLLFTHVLLLL